MRTCIRVYLDAGLIAVTLRPRMATPVLSFAWPLYLSALGRVFKWATALETDLARVGSDITATPLRPIRSGVRNIARSSPAKQPPQAAVGPAYSRTALPLFRNIPSDGEQAAVVFLAHREATSYKYPPGFVLSTTHPQISTFIHLIPSYVYHHGPS